MDIFKQIVRKLAPNGDPKAISNARRLFFERILHSSASSPEFSKNSENEKKSLANGMSIVKNSSLKEKNQTLLLSLTLKFNDMGEDIKKLVQFENLAQKLDEFLAFSIHLFRIFRF